MKICLLWNQFLICYRNVTFCTNLFLIYVSFSLYFMSSFETGLLFQSLGHFVNIGISFSMCSDWKVFSGSYKKISAPTKKYHWWAISPNDPIFNNNNKGILLVCIHNATVLHINTCKYKHSYKWGSISTGLHIHIVITRIGWCYSCYLGF